MTFKSDKDRLEQTDINVLMNDVLVSGVLFLDSGLWMYYRTDLDFDAKVWPQYEQQVNEPFKDFIIRVILGEAQLEKGYDEPLVNINIAIHAKK